MNQQKNNGQLAADIEAANTRKMAFFAMLWFFLATTTAVFGWSNLQGLWLPLTRAIGNDGESQMIWARILGALSAVLVLDLGYKAWDHVKQNASETAAQFNVAAMTEYITFGVSCYFTASVLIALFPALFGVELIDQINTLGAIIFVVVCVWSGIAMFLFNRFAPENMRKSNETLINGRALTERLSFERAVKSEALALASKQAVHAAPRLKNIIAHSWEADLAAGVIGQIESDKARGEIRDAYDKTITGETTNQISGGDVKKSLSNPEQPPVINITTPPPPATPKPAQNGRSSKNGPGQKYWIPEVDPVNAMREPEFKEDDTGRYGRNGTNGTRGGSPKN